MLRLGKRLTQRAVAEKLGISQASYWQFEVAYKEPSADVRRKIARILGVPVRDLLPAAEKVVS